MTSSLLDPVDLETELFDISINSKSDNSDLVNKSLTPKVSTSSLHSPTGASDEANKSKQRTLSKKRSYSSYDYEITVQSIQNTVYEHALFLLKNYRLKQLFGMFGNLYGFNIIKWLQQFKYYILKLTKIIIFY